MKGEDLFNIRLLKEIEKYPCLYNFNLAEYTSREATDKAWNSIADTLKKSSEDCRTRWKNLRGSLTRNLSQKLKFTGKTPKTFYLTKYMQFVMPFARSKYGCTYEELKLRAEQQSSSFTSITKEDTQDSWVLNNDSVEIFEVEEEEEEAEEEKPSSIVVANSIQASLSSTSTNNKDPLQTCVTEQMDHNDADRHFLLSLLPHLNCFTPNEKLQFQIKTLNVIDEIMNKKDIKKSNNSYISC